MQNGVIEMYHALVNERDILTLFTIPNLKIFWCCRCHLVADDKSAAHEHLHALVQYDKGHTHQAFKKRLQRSKQKLHPKTTFKKILCSDHAVGVLRYISCRDGQKRSKNRDADGLVGKSHTHCSRCVFERSLLHERNAKKNGGCRDVSCLITESIWDELSDEWLEENVSGDSEYANMKRSEFYKAAKGIEIKKLYKEKSQKKKELIDSLMELKASNDKAKLTKETIARLMDLL